MSKRTQGTTSTNQGNTARGKKLMAGNAVALVLVLGYFEAFNREGKTIVMVTHDPQAADRATRTLRLTAGKIVAEEQSGGCLNVA